MKKETLLLEKRNIIEESFMTYLAKPISGFLLCICVCSVFRCES